MKIGLALSGGGIRAAVFHCGVLQRLAIDNMLEEVWAISTVSGGSLVSGLIWSENKLKWPTSTEYLQVVLPAIKQHITGTNIEKEYFWATLSAPWLWNRGRAHLLARAMEKNWRISGRLNQLEDKPLWSINTTCYETGKNWRFSQEKMGDYVTKYVARPTVTIADAIAASAGVPGIIGPLVIKSKEHTWTEYGGTTITKTPHKQYKLWDGGVYDNLGVEALFKPREGLQKGIELLLVSDASAPLGIKSWSAGGILRTVRRGGRLLDIPRNQVRGLYARMLVKLKFRDSE